MGFFFFFFLKDLEYPSKAKDIVVKLALPHIQSTWGSRREMIRAAKLATYYNYFSKKKNIHLRIREKT